MRGHGMKKLGLDRSQKGPMIKKQPARFRSLRRFWAEYQWQIVLVIFVFSFILGYVGFYKYTHSLGKNYSNTDLFYLTLQLSMLESGAVSGPVSWELEVARLLLPMITAYTAVLAGAALFRNQIQILRLNFIRDHVIICGLGEKGWLLASQLRQNGHTIVVIEINADNPKIDLCREMGIVVLERDAKETANLIKASLIKASYLVAVCADDSTNAEIAIAAKQISSKRKRGTLNCVIHIINPHLCDLMRELEFDSEKFPTFRLEIFNIFERGARILISEHPLYKQINSSELNAPHMLVVGCGFLGENLIIHTGRIWYESWKTNAIALTILVVDRDAENKISQLVESFPKLSLCCKFIPVDMDPELSGFQPFNSVFNEFCESKINKIYICLNDNSAGLQSAFSLRQRLDCNQPSIILSMPEDSGLAKIFSSEQESDILFHNIIPFGLIKRTCTPDLVIGGTHEILAQAVHEDYLHNRLAEGIQMGQKRSMVSWDDLPQDLRESNRRQVDHIRLKLDSIGYGIKPLRDWDSARFQFSLPEIERMAQIEHDHWMQERLRNGWKYASGPEDAQNKTHPDLIPWDQLPERIKDMDRQPAFALPKLLARSGFQVFRWRRD